MVIAGYKLSPLWQTQMLPFFFLLSAVSMGFAVVVFESIVSSIAFQRPFETRMLANLARIIMWLLIIYLVLRLLDLLVRGQLGLIFQGNLASSMFILENALYLVPVLLMASRPMRSSLRWLFVASVSMLLAGSLYRFNAFLIGFNPGPGWSYFPSLPEIFITLGIVAFELMAYLYIVKRFPVLPKVEPA